VEIITLAPRTCEASHLADGEQSKLSTGIERFVKANTDRALMTFTEMYPRQFASTTNPSAQ
jgi:hypothetical protein